MKRSIIILLLLAACDGKLEEKSVAVGEWWRWCSRNPYRSFCEDYVVLDVRDGWVQFKDNKGRVEESPVGLFLVGSTRIATAAEMATKVKP